ncbi:MAG: hypothetical protein AAGA88_06455 [Pseudomonadota bacterium]
MNVPEDPNESRVVNWRGAASRILQFGKFVVGIEASLAKIINFQREQQRQTGALKAQIDVQREEIAYLRGKFETLEKLLSRPDKT